MTSIGYTFGHHKIVGNPEADWSHAAAYLIDLYEARGDQDEQSTDFETQVKFNQDLINAKGVNELPEDSLTLAEGLAEDDGVDISNFPGGSNYSVSVVSSSNPLGLPGYLWAMVSEASEGALVAAIVRVTGNGELEVKFPDGKDWQPLTDPSVLSDWNYVGVTEDAIPLFKNYDRDNTLGVISSYPLSDIGPFPSPAQLDVRMTKEIPEPRTEDDEYWENSGETYGTKSTSPVIASVVITSAEDLDEAIAAAAEDPEVRWYVERRMKALGLEALIPWHKG